MSIPKAKAPLLEGKRGLIVGIAKERSIAWGCAKAFRALGAELAIIYVNEKTKKYVESLACEACASIVIPILAHDSSKLITGETLYVDGGYHIID